MAAIHTGWRFTFGSREGSGCLQSLVEAGTRDVPDIRDAREQILEVPAELLISLLWL